jgi:hypothetical protein
MIRLLLLLVLFVPMAHSQQSLASYTDRNRVLLLFAPDSRNPVYQQQLTALSRHAAEITERDLIVLSVLEDPTPPITPSTLRVTLGPGLPDTEQLAVRHRFKIAPNGFTVLLIGKDGGEKFRSTEPVSIKNLSEIIDAMPMRQSEIRDRAHGR